VLGLSDRIKVMPADTTSATDDLRQQNPLGKIPTLVLEDGMTLFDSRVIVEYLDMLAGGGKIIPRPAAKRFPVLRLQALCDGLCDAALLIVYEGRYRPETMKVQAWVDLQQGKIERALAALEAEPPKLTRQLHVGHIMLACALGYLDLRFAGAWRKKHPKLRKWVAKFEERVPAYTETRVQP
jgi:glutathione S-transferase